MRVIPLLSHCEVDFNLGKPKKLGDYAPVIGNHDRSPTFPCGPSARINAELSGGNPLGPTEFTALGRESFWQRLGSRRFRVITQEPTDRWDMLDRWFMKVVFPVDHSELGDSQALSGFLLGQPQH